MTVNEFNALCGRYLIEPSVALENNDIVELVLNIRDTSCENAKNGFRNLLIQTLENQF